MTNKYRVILDTNIVISAVCFKKSALNTLFHAVCEDHILLHSVDTYAELEEVLFRNKFDPYISTTERQSILNTVREIANFVAVKTAVNDIPHDPADNHILALAISGKADYLVTGNTNHFMTKQIKRKYNRLTICTATEFLESSAIMIEL